MRRVEVGSYVRVGTTPAVWHVVRLDGGGTRARLSPSSLSLAGRGRVSAPVEDLVLVTANDEDAF